MEISLLLSGSFWFVSSPNFPPFLLPARPLSPLSLRRFQPTFLLLLELPHEVFLAFHGDDLVMALIVHNKDHFVLASTVI